MVSKGPIMYLEVATTTVVPHVVAKYKGKLLLPTVADDGQETLPTLDFGELPVGQERVLPLTLTNVADSSAVISHNVQDPFGPFSLLMSPTEMLPGGSQTVNVAFRPKKEAGFKERLVLECQGNRVRLIMTGHGVSPAFAMEGLEVENGMVDLGDVLVGGEAQAPFTLQNNSPFEVTYTIDLRSIGEANASSLLPFDCTPPEAPVPAEGEQTVALTFAPDTQSLSYAAMLNINVPNQKEKLEFRLVGRCWQQAMGLYENTPEAKAAPLSIDRFKDQPKQESEDGGIALAHVFPQAAAEAGEEATYEVVVSNCGAKGAGDFSFENIKEAEELGFTLDPPSGKVDAGGQVAIQVKYTSPEGSGLAMWNTVSLRGQLKGGDPAPAGGAVPIELLLRGFMCEAKE